MQMKKLLFFFTASIAATGANAQYQSGFQLLEDQNVNQISNVRPQPLTESTANKTTAGGTRWYNHAETMREAAGVSQVDFYDTSHAFLYAMWQDSTVRYPAPSSNLGIGFLSMSQMFHPQSPIFSDQAISSNQGKIAVTNGDAYTLDSVRIRGYYSRTNTGYVDTLLVTLVYENAVKKFSKFWFTGGSTLANHGIDTFFASMYNKSDYMLKPISQIGYGSSGNFLTAVNIKVPLNNAVKADSLPDGTHLISVAPGISLIPGSKIAVSATFKSGTNYVAGTPITNYNYFEFLSHETDPLGFVQYLPGDYNQSAVVRKDTSKSSGSTTLNIYYPGLGYTAPYRAELHNVAWKVSCATCPPTSVKNIGENIVSVNVYPNPAKDIASFVFMVRERSSISLTMKNAVGQVVKSESFGSFNAMQHGKVDIDISDLDPGLYFYTLDAGGSKLTNRMIVIH